MTWEKCQPSFFAKVFFFIGDRLYVRGGLWFRINSVISVIYGFTGMVFSPSKYSLGRGYFWIFNGKLKIKFQTDSEIFAIRRPQMTEKFLEFLSKYIGVMTTKNLFHPLCMFRSEDCTCTCPQAAHPATSIEYHTWHWSGTGLWHGHLITSP